MRTSLIILLYLISFIGCRPSSASKTPSSLIFGDGDQILQPILDTVLAGHKTLSAEIKWGGISTNKDFSADDSLVVVDANLGDIATKLTSEIDKLPEQRGWTSHSSGVGGVGKIQNYEITYVEGDAWFSFNFILVQDERNVDILILHKGVRR